MQPEVYSHSHLLPAAFQLLCFKKLCKPWDSFCFLHIQWCAGWGRLTWTICTAGTHFHGVVFAPLPHGNAALPGSRHFPLWFSMCLFRNSLCFLAIVALPPRSFVSIRGRPCATQALKAQTWEGEGEGVSVAKEELRGPHPLSLFGSGVGWQLCSRRHRSHLEWSK